MAVSTHTRLPTQLLHRPAPNVTFLVGLVAQSLVPVEGRDAFEVYRIQFRELEPVRGHRHRIYVRQIKLTSRFSF